MKHRIQPQGFDEQKRKASFAMRTRSTHHSRDGCLSARIVTSVQKNTTIRTEHGLKNPKVEDSWRVPRAG